MANPTSFAINSNSTIIMIIILVGTPVQLQGKMAVMVSILSVPYICMD